MKGKRIFKRIFICLLAVIVLFGIYVGYLWFSYKRLPDKLTLNVERSGTNSYFDEGFTVTSGRAYMIMTYNAGFGAYRRDFSFFMDGGKSSWGKDEETVIASICGMGEIINNVSPDFVLLQEVDVDGTRSYHVNELELFSSFLKGYYYDFAQNYDSPFLFWPPWQPHGANQSGIATYSRGEIVNTMRRSLPVSDGFGKLTDLDRCYSISRIPVENGKQLCIYNVHLSAYGSSEELHTAQFAMLYEDMAADYKKGNYVICGGDYNHDLKASGQERAEGVPKWAYPFPQETLPKGFRLALDTARESEYVAHNSCRDANIPYDEEKSYTVTVDGFLVSDNISVNFYQHMDWGYEFSDHDPVLMQFILR